MKDRHLPSETRRENLHQLGRQGNFRHQHQRGPTLIQHMINQMEVDLSFPTSRHAIQQRSGGLSLVQHLAQTVADLLLLLIELGLLPTARLTGQFRPAERLLCLQSKQAPLFQRL